MLDVWGGAGLFHCLAAHFLVALGLSDAIQRRYDALAVRDCYADDLFIFCLLVFLGATVRMT